MIRKAETFEEMVIAANFDDVNSIIKLKEFTEGTGLEIEDVGYSPVKSPPDLKVPLSVSLGVISREKLKKK